MLTRRNFLESTAMFSASMAVPFVAFAELETAITLRLRPENPVIVPADFTGLGYEMSSVAPLGLVSTANHRYVRLVQGLGSAGVLRVGGIVADYTRYDAHGSILAERENTLITQESVEQFAGFLSKVGWTAIWSVNFAQGSLDEAAAEVRAVSSILGNRLQAIEIGNEVDNYARGDKPFRKQPYDYETYRREYNDWRDAILKSAPNTRFAAPDVASEVEWVERMARDARNDVQLLTTHYYRNGQKRGSAEQLLLPDPRLTDILVRLRTAAQQSGIPWRMCETNSFSGGGLPGVSNSLTGALWTLDFMLLLASYGCAGVNIETGVNQLGFISSYSPIQDDGRGRNSAGSPYYGMLAFGRAMSGCDQVLPVEVDSRGANITAYVLGTAGRPRSLVVINRDGARDVTVSTASLGMNSGLIQRLASAVADSPTSITFGGAFVAPDGRWKAKTHERLRSATVAIPRMSAIVVHSSL